MCLKIVESHFKYKSLLFLVCLMGIRVGNKRWALFKVNIRYKKNEI